MANQIGIDISEHQGAVNWDAIKAAVNFVIIRAGYGGGGVDKQFKKNQAEARKRGITLGYYFFAYPGRSSGAQQARDFANIVGALQEGEFVALDIENEPTYGRRLVASDVAWSKEFLDTAKSLFGVKPMVYMDGGVKSSFNWQPVVAGDYGLWIATWGANNGQIPASQPNPAPWPVIALWQYTSRANLGGISPVDANVFLGSLANLRKYGKQGGGSTPAPTPTPTPTPAPAPSNSYTVNKPIPGYVNASDAASRRNSNSTVPKGTYAIFNQAQGMINVTRQAGVAGWWINPGDNGAAAAPGQSGNNYTLGAATPGYADSIKARNRTGANSTVPAGTYRITNQANGATHIVRLDGSGGWWINP